MVSSTGLTEQIADYSPFGMLTTLLASNALEFGYTGHFSPMGGNLFLAPFRGYTAELAQWLNRDPIREKGGINLFNYCNANPINLVDRTGSKGEPPKTGAYVCDRSADPFGHTSLCVDGNCFGFGPDGVIGGIEAILQIPYPGVVGPDPRSGYRGKCDYVGNSDCFKHCLKTLVNQDTVSPPRYQVFGFNCKHWVGNIVAACQTACGF